MKDTRNSDDDRANYRGTAKGLQGGDEVQEKGEDLFISSVVKFQDVYLGVGLSVSTASTVLVFRGSLNQETHALQVWTFSMNYV